MDDRLCRRRAAPRPRSATILLRVPPSTGLEIPFPGMQVQIPSEEKAGLLVSDRVRPDVATLSAVSISVRSAMKRHAQLADAASSGYAANGDVIVRQGQPGPSHVRRGPRRGRHDTGSRGARSGADRSQGGSSARCRCCTSPAERHRPHDAGFGSPRNQARRLAAFRAGESRHRRADRRGSRPTGRAELERARAGAAAAAA